METIVRKEWGSPFGKFQVFTPQEFVAACIPVENLGDGSWHFDFHNVLSYGIYDGQNYERISGAWGPAYLKNKGNQTFTVDVYRWCTRDKPTYWGDNNWDDLWTPSSCRHRWSSDGPTGNNAPWTWYDGHDSSGWNSPSGHFVLVATNATLKTNASGLKATLYADLSGGGYSGGTGAS